MLVRLRNLIVAVVLLIFAVSCGSSAVPVDPIIARVNGVAIKQSLFNLRYQSTLTALGQAGAPTPGNGSTKDPMNQQIRSDILKSLITDEIIAQEAKAQGVAVTSKQIQDEINQDATVAGGMNNLNQQLSESGGSLEQLKDEINARLNEQHLENLFAQQRANEVLQQLNSGADFANLAKQFSDDAGTRDKGGQSGPATLEQINATDPVIGKAVGGLVVGQVSKTPVHDAAGYDVLLLSHSNGGILTLRRILVSAAANYTVKDRPDWFTQVVYAAIADYCAKGKIQVLNGRNDLCNPSATTTPKPPATVAPR